MQEYLRNFETQGRTQEVVDGIGKLLSGVVPPGELEQLTVASIQGKLAQGALTDFRDYSYCGHFLRSVL